MKTIWKRALACVLILALCCPAAWAEEETREGVRFDPLEIYRGMIGNVWFSLPGMPVVLNEADYPGFWKDSVLMFGRCGKDGSEYQLSTADIAEGIAGFQERYPDSTAEENAAQALFAFSRIHVEMGGGAVGRPRLASKDGYLIGTFEYSYEDAPDSSYSAVCILDGSIAVCLQAEACQHSAEALNALLPATEEQRSALESDGPAEENFFGLPLTFPCAPVYSEFDGGVMASAFARDFTCIIAQHIPVGLKMDAEPEEVGPGMQKLAVRLLNSVSGGEPKNGALSGSADTRWQYDFTGIVDAGFGEALGQPWLGRIYAGEDGVWYLLCADTETGRAFMDAAGKQAAEEMPYSGLAVEQAAAAAADREEDAPADLYQFTKALRALLSEHAYGCRAGAEELEISQAIFCGDRWVRHVSIGSPEVYALLIMNTDQEPGVVNQVRVLGLYETAYGDFAPFAACCLEAAGGPGSREALQAFAEAEKGAAGEIETPGGYRAAYSFLNPEDSDLQYHLATMTALEAAPQERGIPQPGDEDEMQPIRAHSILAGDFEARWAHVVQTLYDGAYALQYISAQTMDDGKTMRVYVMDGETAVAVITDGEDDFALIERVMVTNLTQFPPLALMGGLISFAAVSGIPDDQFISLCGALMEYPMWQDLCGMWPIGAWNGVMLLTGERDVGDASVPCAFVVGVPE